MKAGDIVVLKSGGPKMVISCVESSYKFATCCWIHEGSYQSANIPTKAIRPWHEPENKESSVTLYPMSGVTQSVSFPNTFTVGELQEFLAESGNPGIYFKLS